MGDGEVKKEYSSVRNLLTKHSDSFDPSFYLENSAINFLMHSKGISALTNPNEKPLIYADNNLN